MKNTLKKICELQSLYSSENTPEMQERGRLIRSVLVDDFKKILPDLQLAFDPVFDDIAVAGSDGIGRKTEAPWVRLFSESMSPNPREGFYLVVHFAADGSAVFFTVGCGSTIWRGGDLQAVSDGELEARTSWARSVVLQKWKTLNPFVDQINLGAKAKLPKTFEKATAFAKKVSLNDLDDAYLKSLLSDAAKRLNEIYLAQLDRRDISPGEQGAAQISEIANPLKRSTGRQGRGLTAQERQAVELQAMKLAIDFLTEQGFQCQDTSANRPFDVLAEKDGQRLMVEVKGTTSDVCESVLMTKNEVDLHREYKGETGLIIVSQIKLSKSEGQAKATGGVVEDLLYWDIDSWFSEPIAFQVSRK